MNRSVMVAACLLAGVVLATVIATFASRWRTEAEARRPSDADELSAERAPAISSDALPLAVDPPLGPGDAAADVAPTDPAARVASTTVAAVRLLVVGDDDAPIEGAIVSWTSTIGLSARLGDDEHWNAVRGASVLGTSDAAGAAAIEVPNGLATRGTLAVSHPEHLAFVEALERPPASAKTVRLSAHRPIPVQVVGVEGAPAPGARVLHTGVRDPVDQDPWSVFLRESFADATGRTQLHPYEGIARVRARLDDRVSAPFEGASPGELVLELRATFSVRGSVARHEPGDARADVLAYAETEDSFELIGESTIRDDGSFGPTPIALVAAASYHFELVAGDALGQSEAVAPAPEPGEIVTLSFESRPGHRFLVTALDGDGAPLAGVRLYGTWGSTEPASSRVVQTGEGGVAALRGCAAEDVWIWSVHPEYADTWHGPFEADLTLDVTSVEILLTPCGRIRGRVVHDGEPEPDFEVVRWTASGQELVPKTFSGRTDGTFSIERVPAGPVTLIASSPRYPRCEPVVVDVPARGEVSVVLELPDGLAGRGRVVDAATRQPIAGASVQPYTNVRSQLLTPWGAPLVTGNDGGFFGEGFAPGDARLMVDAEGYGQAIFNAIGVPGRVLDFGVLPLHAGATLTIEVAPADAAAVTSYQLRVRGTRFLPWTAFPSTSRLTLEGCTPGRYTFEVDGPDGHRVDFHRTLAGAGPWHETLHVDVPSSVELRVRWRDGDALPDDLWIQADQGLAVGGTRTEVADVDETGTARFRSLEPGPVSFSARSEREGDLGALTTNVADAPDQSFVLLLERHERVVRLVDATKRPLGGVRLTLRCPGDDLWFSNIESSPDGLVSWFTAPCAKPRAYVRIEGGACTGIELDPSSSPSAVQEIVVQAEHEVRVRFRDGSEPLSGFTADLYEPSLGFSIAPGQPDAEGLASWHNLSDQSYEVRVDAPGFWPLAASVQATRGGPASPIQMRRVGNALLQFERPEEVTSLALLSVEYGDDVVGWLADGRIRSSTGSLAAGPDGRVALEGLPRGSYRWEMTFDSVSKSGEFVVPAHGTATVELP